MPSTEPASIRPSIERGSMSGRNAHDGFLASDHAFAAAALSDATLFA